MERIATGEETDHYYVSDLFAAAVELWNVCVERMREKLQDPQWILAQMDGDEGEVGESELNSALEKLNEKMSQLPKIEISGGSEGLRQGCFFF